jgi:TPR repeat protein
MRDTVRPARLPYPGLRPFRSNETDLFFGRESCIDQMVDRLADTHFLAVLGSSGSGKSSLVRTGLLDALYLGLLAEAGSGWRIADLRPAGNPLTNLAAALLGAVARKGAAEPDEATVAKLTEFLRRGPRSIIEWCLGGNLPPETSLLILVDQFEELFRYTDYSGQQESEAFVALLIESARSRSAPIYVAITMRSEYLGPCALIPDLAEQINAGLYLTRRMTRDETREAIVGPALVSGFELEEGLVNHLLNDLVSFAPWDAENNVDRLQVLARRADQLPLMQHVLNRLWIQARAAGAASPGATPGATRILLRDTDYVALGGLAKALSSHAEEVLNSLGADQEIAGTIFRALVSGNTVATAIRRPCRFDELVALAGNQRVAQGVREAREAVENVIEAFRSPDCNFLLTSPAGPLKDNTVIDISHESLIRQWNRLSEWLIEEARSAEQYRYYEQQAVRWDKGERLLLTGADLRDAITWRERQAPLAAWAARYSAAAKPADGFALTMAFIGESERQWRRARTQRRIIAYAAAGLTTLLVIISGSKLFEGYAKGRGDSYYFGNDVKQDYAKAMTWYRRAAELGNADAAHYVGLLYEDGDGVPQNYVTALTWYRRAAAGGNATAEYDIGVAYAGGLGVPQDYGQAMKWYLKAAPRYAWADTNIGWLYFEGDGVKQDYGQAMNWYQKSAAGIGDAAGNVDAASAAAAADDDIGVLYEYGEGVAQDYVSAMYWYQRGAAGGNATAERNIAIMYENGRGVATDYFQAFIWYQRAAAQGDSDAENNLGRLYDYGEGVTQDFRQAMIWYQKAADAGVTVAYNNIGTLYDAGEGVKQDYAQAMTWYLKAAAAGDELAERNIGLLYEHGRGVPRDYAKALFWYGKSAAQHDADAENHIGNLYDEGHGVKQDYAKAMTWYQQAANDGDANGEENIGDLYAYGDGVPQNVTKAETWYQTAFRDGDADAEYRLEQLQYQANDYIDAMVSLNAAANAGSADAEDEYGKDYVSGQLVGGTDFGKAMSWFQKAAANGSSDAQVQIGLLYLKGDGVAQSDALAAQWIGKGDDDDTAGAEGDIAQRYVDGNGVPADNRQALRWFEKSAQDGSDDAADRAGFLYLDGTGIRHDRKAAAAAFQLALKDAQAALASDPANAADMGDVAWELILNGNPQAAVTISKQAITRAPGLVWLQTNLADALMMTGQPDAAREIYLRNKRVQDTGNGTAWTSTVLGDFSKLRALGYQYPLMDEIRKDFAS